MEISYRESLLCKPAVALLLSTALRTIHSRDICSGVGPAQYASSIRNRAELWGNVHEPCFALVRKHLTPASRAGSRCCVLVRMMPLHGVLTFLSC